MFSNGKNRIIKRYGDIHTTGTPINVDTLLEDLLLNDEIIIDSMRLKELAAIINAIGMESTSQLIKLGFIKFLLDPMDGGFLNKNERDMPLLDGQHNLIIFRAGGRDYIHSAFSNLESLLGFKNKKFIRLKGLVANSLVEYSDEADGILLSQTRTDLRSGQFPIRPLEYALKEKRIKMADDFSIKIRAEISWQTENIFKFESNLLELTSAEEVDLLSIIQNAVFGINSCNKKILEMEAFDCKNEFRENELFILGDKLNMIAGLASPGKIQRTLNRVLSLKKFPEIKLSAIANIDIEKFVKIKQSKECKEFRDWLRTINNSTTDKEILDYVNNFRSRISGAFYSETAKIVRFLVNTAVGFIPVYGLPASIAVGSADSFLLNKILPENGVVSFVNDKIPSIFKAS